MKVVKQIKLCQREWDKIGYDRMGWGVGWSNMQLEEWELRYTPWNIQDAYLFIVKTLKNL